MCLSTEAFDGSNRPKSCDNRQEKELEKEGSTCRRFSGCDVHENPANRTLGYKVGRCTPDLAKVARIRHIIRPRRGNSETAGTNVSALFAEAA
jgi:hypothetical protein